ncbi:tRNA pseudouridine(38-40) synthase TruA [Natronomonas sp. EA1]|uniref:tRNA pseudouridine(38-40) synthase TruA n=1 Tax=Natronomonas sp. EA1 TaxID=3421655 RepID=UPI003EBBB20E
MRAFRVAYDGTRFRGFQRQPHGDTVEDALFRALDRLDIDTPPEGYAAAGRTDAGVSATHQTVAFDAPDWLTPRALNSELPASVRSWAHADAPAGFHATHDARERRYAYHLYAPEGETPPGASAPISELRLRDAAQVLGGRHDFHNLTPDEDGTDRHLRLRVDREGPFLVVRFRAGGFPREFVRRAVTLLRAVGAGDRDLAFVERVCSDERLQGPDGIAPAPPGPLLLTSVAYRLDWTVDEQAAASRRAVFAARRADRLAGARVAGALAEGVPTR